MVSKQQGRRNLRDLFTRESSVRSTGSNSISKNATASPAIISPSPQLSSRTVTSTSVNSGGDDIFPIQAVVAAPPLTTAVVPAQQPQPRPRHRVRFSEPVYVDLEDSDDEIEPLSEEERRNYFYTSKDLENFEKDMALTALMYIKRKEHGIPWEETTYTIRGVEEILRQNRSDKTSPREEHSKRVISEQARLAGSQQQQPNKGKDHVADRLCMASCQSSKADRLRALHRAREDAVSAGSASSSNNRRLFSMKRIFGSSRSLK